MVEKKYVSNERIWNHMKSCFNLTREADLRKHIWKELCKLAIQWTGNVIKIVIFDNLPISELYLIIVTVQYFQMKRKMQQNLKGTKNRTHVTNW